MANVLAILSVGVGFPSFVDLIVSFLIIVPAFPSWLPWRDFVIYYTLVVVLYILVAAFVMWILCVKSAIFDYPAVVGYNTPRDATPRRHYWRWLKVLLFVVLIAASLLPYELVDISASALNAGLVIPAVFIMLALCHVLFFFMFRPWYAQIENPSGGEVFFYDGIYQNPMKDDKRWTSYNDVWYVTIVMGVTTCVMAVLFMGIELVLPQLYGFWTAFIIWGLYLIFAIGVFIYYMFNWRDYWKMMQERSAGSQQIHAKGT